MGIMVVWKLLEGIFFEVAGGVVWEIFQPYYKQHFHKSWNELYLDSFEMAFNSEKTRLAKFTDAEPSFGKERLRIKLNQELPSDVRNATTTKLSERRPISIISKIIADDDLIVNLPGHPLSHDEYNQQIYHLVMLNLQTF